jgi:osmotically inducible lipoprotein OsmB
MPTEASPDHMTHKENSMTLKTFGKLSVAVLLAASMAGCSSWDNMSHRQKATVTGAGLGGLAGAVITGGGILGTVGGAAIGGIIGDQVGKNP